MIRNSAFNLLPTLDKSIGFFPEDTRLSDSTEWHLSHLLSRNIVLPAGSSLCENENALMYIDYVHELQDLFYVLLKRDLLFSNAV